MFEFQKLIDCERETGDSAEVFAVQEPLVSVTRKRERKVIFRWEFLFTKSRIISETDVILVGKGIA